MSYDQPRLLAALKISSTAIAKVRSGCCLMPPLHGDTRSSLSVPLLIPESRPVHFITSESEHNVESGNLSRAEALLGWPAWADKIQIPVFVFQSRHMWLSFHKTHRPAVLQPTHPPALLLSQDFRHVWHRIHLLRQIQREIGSVKFFWGKLFFSLTR